MAKSTDSDEDKRWRRIYEKYLKTVQTQLSPVFNHAVKYYDLPRNPVKDAETIDAERSLRINFLTK